MDQVRSVLTADDVSDWVVLLEKPARPIALSRRGRARPALAPAPRARGDHR